MITKEVKDKNPKDHEGRTPLHDAAEFGHSKICKLILDATKNWHPKTSKGLTPLQLADQKGHHNIKKLILGAKQKKRNHGQPSEVG